MIAIFKGRLLLVAIVLSACSTPAEHFYTLRPVAVLEEITTSHQGLSINLGQVTLPELVDRPQVVLQAGDHQVSLPEQRRWAESLRSAIPRVIASNLRQQLPGALVGTRSDVASDPRAKYQVAIDILRFESMLAQKITLDANWRIQMAGQLALTGTTGIVEPVQGPSFEDLAEAHSRGLAVLSKQIAQAINRAEQRK